MYSIMEEERPRTPINWNEIEKDLTAYIVSNRLQEILDKVRKSDPEGLDLMPSAERQLWYQHFAYVISDKYELTPKELLTSHDAWLRTIEMENDISDKVEAFIANAHQYSDIQQFMDFVFDQFTFAELASVGSIMH